jgi:ABC-type polysaccharide/polyol phosphate export permease
LTFLFGALFLLLTGFGACSATLQWHRAELIDDDPVRGHVLVTVFGTAGVLFVIGYLVTSRREARSTASTT